MAEEWTDEELLAGLAEYLRHADPVPSHLIAAAKATITARDPGYAAFDRDVGAVEPALDHGLARLVFDSALARPTALATRSTTLGRTLTLIAVELTIELELSKDHLYGQLIPATPGEVRLCTLSGEVTTGRIDDVGHFVLRGIPGEPFRLRCRTGSGEEVSTVWICP
jgi:hypothetical protein